MKRKDVQIKVLPSLHERAKKAAEDLQMTVPGIYETALKEYLERHDKIMERLKKENQEEEAKKAA